MKNIFAASKALAILLTVAILLALTVPAFAWKDGGEYPSNPSGQYSTDFAPNTCTSVVLGTKSVTNVPVDNTSAFKFWFTATTAGTATTGIFKPSTITTWKDTGTARISTDKFTVGKGVKFIGFAPISSATSNTLTYCKQTR
jgi:hypothetical protein